MKNVKVRVFKRRYVPLTNAAYTQSMIDRQTNRQTTEEGIPTCKPTYPENTKSLFEKAQPTN